MMELLKQFLIEDKRIFLGKYRENFDKYREIIAK